MAEPSVWIVELLVAKKRKDVWEPTTGCGLDRIHGREVLSEWKSNLPDDQLRLRRYTRKDDRRG